MRLILALCGAMRLVTAQAGAGSVAPPAPTPQAAAAPAPVMLQIAPLRPADLTSPYASPRDAARHRLQSTQADLESKRDIRAAVRGFADALATDPTYAEAAFNLGIVAALAQEWDDAALALGEAARLDPAVLGPQAAPQTERLQLIARLEKTPEGQRTRRYDEALLPLLLKLGKMPEAEAMSALAEAGHIDPKRWEAPALLAGLSGNGHGYDVASKFLRIAVDNASTPGLKAQLEKALAAAEREMRYAAARAAAEAAADGGDHAKAAEFFETAWSAVPARADNGMLAASELLLQDDTTRAARLLVRLRNSGDNSFASSAASMLKQLEPIEPATKADAKDDAGFLLDPGAPEPVRISTLLPSIDRTQMELLARPLPKLAHDSQPVLLLASFSADPAEASLAAVLPPLPEPAIRGESPWREVQEISKRSAGPATPAASPHTLETADLANGSKVARVLHVTSEPPGAAIFVDARPDAACHAPCDVRVSGIAHSVRASMPGWKDEQRAVRVPGKSSAVEFPLTVLLGNVLVEAPATAPIRVNGITTGVSTPAELALMPGVYSIAADFGAAARPVMLTVKPGAHLRVQLRPE